MANASADIEEVLDIVGFDDVDAAIQFEPNLTTIKVDKEEMGAVAMKSMADMISNARKSLGKILLPVELIIRKSA